MSLVNTETGEVVSAAVAVPEPTSLVAVNDQCAAIEAWSESCDSVPLLKDATNKLAAIDEYLTRTSTEGRGRVAAAMRRLEVRIGKLLGPPRQGERSDLSLASDKSDFTPNQRSEFRAMAEHPEVVEQAIEESTDDEPASRRKVVSMIPKTGGPRRSSLTDSAKRAGWDFRKSVERLERVCADDRFPANREQVAAQLRGHLSYAIEVCQHLLDGLDQQPMED